MGSTQDVVAQIRKQYPYLEKEFGVRKIGLFGSVARGTSGPQSDIDLVVEFDQPLGLKFIHFVDYLENVFGCKVDVLTRAGIKHAHRPDLSAEIERDIIYV